MISKGLDWANVLERLAQDIKDEHFILDCDCIMDWCDVVEQQQPNELLTALIVTATSIITTAVQILNL